MRSAVKPGDRPSAEAQGQAGAAPASCDRARRGACDQSLHLRGGPGRWPVSRLLTLLLVALALIVPVAVGMVSAGPGEDGSAGARARLADAVAAMRARHAEAAVERAQQISAGVSALGLFSPDLADILASGAGPLLRQRSAYLINGDGTVAAAHGTESAAIPPEVAILAGWFRASHDGARRSAGEAPRGAPPSAETDIIVVGGRPTVAAVAAVSTPPGAATSDPSLLLVTLAPFDKEFVSALAQAAGVPRLRLEPEPSPSDGALLWQTDRRGRIVAWFAWDLAGAGWDRMSALGPLLGAGALGLLALAGFSLRQQRRALRALKESEQRALKAAHEDPLTLTPNRRKIIELLDEALARRAPDQSVTFIYANLDGFKDVNEVLGHEAGDALLVEAAGRLRAAMPERTAIGRIGSDEFAMVVAGEDGGAGFQAAKAAGSAFSMPFMINGRSVGVSAGIGLSQAPGDGVSGSELIRRADLAARAAKKSGRGRILAFHQGLETENNERRFIERELRQALAEGRLDVAYQPIVAGDGLRVIGAEALARWRHPYRGNIPPAVFVAVAEQTGLMAELGRLVLRRALADACGWSGLYIAINLSPIQMRDRGVVRVVAEALAETGMDPTRVVLEITEGVLIDNPEQAKQRLKELRALGVKIALDDFGSGYSSLNYLRRLPIDKLKIDKEFVSPLGRSANGGVIVQAIVTLGRALGLSVLAEGVETEEQRLLLRLAGCDELQGYLFARPMPQLALAEFLTRAGEAGDYDPSLGQDMFPRVIAER